MDWKYNHYVHQLRSTYRKNHENFIITSLIHDVRLSELRPMTQHHVKRTDKEYYLIDLYYPQIELAIEVDEPYHQGIKERDKERQEIVVSKLNCGFSRICISSGNALAQIEALKLRILDRVEQYKASGEFKEWTEPKYVTFESLRDKHKNTLFVKIKGHVHPKDLYRRQTGGWTLASWKIPKLEKVLIVHNNIVTRAFVNLEWEQYPDDKRKWRYDGDENLDMPSVGHVLEGWTWQNGRAYSFDLS